MRRFQVVCSLALLGALTNLGCVAGYNSILFTTKTNVGLVLETQPPQVSIDIARYEALLAPSYEDGQTPPVLSSARFKSENGFKSNYLGSVFTTGDAALATARLFDAPEWPKAAGPATPGAAPGTAVWDLTAKQWRVQERVFDSGIRLNMEPKMPWFVPKDEVGAVRPVLFGTDTSLGFKAAWTNPATGAMPDYLKLAYQRRELAFAAVTIGPARNEDGTIKKNSDGEVESLVARVPSLLATVDAAVEVGKFLDSRMDYLQYFASGSAATALAMRYDVRKPMLKRLDPEH